MLRVALSGLAQVIFADRPAVGVLVLAATAVVAPWSAVGALAGALAGAAVGRRRGVDPASWRAGLTSYNPVIVGISWGGVLARHDRPATLFALALCAVLALDDPMRRLFARLGTPPLSAAAAVTVWASAWTFEALGDDLWRHPGLLPIGEFGVALAIVLVAIGTLWTAPRAAVFTALVTAAAIAVWHWVLMRPGLGPVGLWAFTIPPAAFGVAAVFLGGSRIGLVMGAAAAVVATLVWMTWVASGLADIVAPVLAPFVLGTTLVLWAVVRRFGVGAFDPVVGRAATIIRDAQRRATPAVVLTGAGVSTASGIPDYVSGAWLDSTRPAADYAYDRYLTSRACREAYWAACERFRQHARAAAPNAAHHSIAALERAGWIDAVVTQNVDGLHHAAGSRTVIELHGNIGRVHCLGCGTSRPWPTVEAWSTADVLCEHCACFLKPAVVAFGEDLRYDAWAAAEQAVSRCGALVVVGTQLAVSSAMTLVATARRRGVPVIFVNTGPVQTTIGPDDVFLNARAEYALPALALRLDGALGSGGATPA